MPHRELGVSTFLSATARELRHAARSLAKAPGYTLTCIAVLALAIGANTAMFGVLDAVLLRPLPYQDPERLAMLWAEIPARGVREGRLAYGDIDLLRRQSRAFADIAFYDPATATLTDPEGAARVAVARASPNLFPLLGVALERGRAYSAEEAERRERVALLSHELWQSRFRGSDDVIGATLELDGASRTIIGVLPESFQLDADVWEPHTLFADWETLRAARGPGSWFAIGRLAPDATLAEAQTELTGIARGLDADAALATASGAGPERSIGIVSLSRQILGQETRLALWAITSAVLAVLLIAATNVASLALTRGAARAKELGIRAALGASRLRLGAALAIEGACLACAAGIVGLGVAAAGVRFVLAFGPDRVARLDEASVDPRALAWAFGLCLLTAALIGFVPALAATRGSAELLGRVAGRGVAGSHVVRRARRAFVVAELALTIVLLSGAGLLARSLWSAQQVELGFDPERVLSVQLAAPGAMPAEERASLHTALLEQVRALPGVQSAAIISDLFVGGVPERPITIEGAARAEPEVVRLRADEASPTFVATLGARLQAGREFSIDDRPAGQRVAIVNDAMARRLWPGADAVGKRFKLGPASSPDAWRTVVGVVGDMRRQGLENEPIAQMFEPIAQNPPRLATLLVRTSTDEPLSVLGAVRDAVANVSKLVPVYDATTLANRVAGFLAPRRFQTALLIGFAAIALVMASVGIYGLIRYTVGLRTREIAIRIATGARDRDVLRLIVGEGLVLCLVGLALGLAGALALGRVASTLLFGVGAGDPPTLVAVSLLLVAVAAGACYFPARRATRIEPLAALREE
jgi:putative ABC transport system permease protein